MLNNLFGGRLGGAGGEGMPTNPQPGHSSLFDEAEVVTDYVDHLPPVPGRATITQEDHGTTLAGGTAVTAGGGTFTPRLVHPHTGGGGGTGGGTPPSGTDAYSGIGSVLGTLGHTMYDITNIEVELAVQRGVTPGDATSRQSFKDFVVNVISLAILRRPIHATPR